MDTTIRRAVAKIAFNYLTYWEGIGFVLDPAFTPVRRYIRFGERPSLEPVRESWKAILADEPTDGCRRLGHIVTLALSLDRQRIVAQVTLFNWIIYEILLCTEPPLAFRTVTRGHFFDVHNHVILELDADQPS